MYKLLKKPFFGRYRVPWTWPESVAQDAWERVTIQSDSGAGLAGVYGTALAGEVKGTIVCAHPLGKAAKGFYLEKGYAELLRSHGYNVLLFDFNGFGESPEGNFSYPLDVLAAGQWAKERNPEYPVGLVGISFGAAWGICALAAPEHPFSAAVLECPFTTLEEYWYRYRFAYIMLKLISAARPGLARSLRPIEKIREINIERVLFIYGSADHVTPSEMGERFLQGLKSAPRAVPADMWLIEGAKHTKGFTTAENDYGVQLFRCFDAMQQQQP
jgi:pimeloyl-ACP methyl ester carboxylesterase